MKAELTALAALPQEERRILRQAWLAFLLVDAGLRFSSVPKVQRLLERKLEAIPRAVPRRDLERLVRLVDIAARHHIRPMRCLERSLVLQALLRRQGEAADLRIGVRKHRDTLNAHAWLEQAGRPLFEPPGVGDRYTPLLRRGEAR
jgi:hypothetical protein